MNNNYPACKCGKIPAFDEDEFEMLICETGHMDIILQTEIEATCKTCKEKFKFKSNVTKCKRF